MSMCNRCGSQDLKYEKYYVKCNECGNIMSKVKKIPVKED